MKQAQGIIVYNTGELMSFFCEMQLIFSFEVIFLHKSKNFILCGNYRQTTDLLATL